MAHKQKQTSPEAGQTDTPFLCPVCKGRLQKDEHRLYCAKRHSFDRSAAGYVNLIVGGKPGATPGDNKEMCVSRNHFLSKGYYHCLAEGVAAYLAGELSAIPAPTVVDAACGEGYYTTAMHQALCNAGQNPLVAGVDLSKHALKYAAKRCHAAQFVAASIFEMPLPDACADAVTNLFAPVADAEFRRVLCPGGLLVIVGPGERHLWELKQFLYENPYPNECKQYDLPGFAPAARLQFEDHIHLDNNQDILDLFSMTPYFWKTPQSAVERLRELQTLTLTVSFELYAFRAVAE